MNDSIALKALRDPGILKYVPELQPFIEELRMRERYHAAKPGCASCKGGVYTKDLVKKVASVLGSLDENKKEKARKYLGIQ